LEEISQNVLALNESCTSMDVMNDYPVDTTEALAGSVSFTEADRGFVYSVARRIVRDDDAADDVTQDALLAAYRHRESFRGQSRYRTWLYRVAVTSALSHLRRRRRDRSTTVENQPAGVDLPCPAPSPERALAAAQTARLVRHHVDALQPTYAEVLRLRLDDDAGEGEVAEALGLTVSTVKIRGHRARRVLRDRLADAR
jgi:RNA polymerase sigma-70 factor (ECF subfamily)